MTSETWYLLFDGSSPDGRGEGVFVGRTADTATAQRHYKKVADDPYCTGKVLIVNDTSIKKADYLTVWK